MFSNSVSVPTTYNNIDKLQVPNELIKVFGVVLVI